LIFRILERQSGLKENPFKYIRRKTEQVQSKKELTEEQFLRIFDSIDKSYPLSIPHRDEMKILFRLGAYTGMRLKDCCLLKIESVNFKNDTIAVTPSKTQKTSAKTKEQEMEIKMESHKEPEHQQEIKIEHNQEREMEQQQEFGMSM